MIVITGAGRSGTTAVALLYQQLGFDLGGETSADDHSGLDHSEFWRLNNRLAVAMGMTMLHPARATAGQTTAAAPLAAATEDHRRGRRGARRHRTALLAVAAEAAPAPPERPLPRVRLAEWERLPRVVEEHRDLMVRLAEQTAVVKDSRFLWTLPIWLAAGARIDHVVVTVRAMTELAEPIDAGEPDDAEVRFTAPELRNAVSYGLGVATTALLDVGVSHTILRFPDFLSDLDELYAGLRFPTPVSAGRFRATARRVFDPKHLAGIAAG